MKLSLKVPMAILATVAIAVASAAGAQDAHEHRHPAAGQAQPSASPVASPDIRQVVDFPPALKSSELANMRDHLLTVSRIQELLSSHEFEKAGELAESRLGMSSFGLHGAHEVAPLMPQGMQEMGTAMHRSASRFAVAAQEAAVDQDLARPLSALTQVTKACVACHAAYRLK